MPLIIKTQGHAGAPVSAADAASAKAWLLKLLSAVVGASPSILAWEQNVSQWNQGGQNLLAFAQNQAPLVAQELQAGAADLASATGAGDVLHADLQNIANLDVLAEVPTISALLDAASASTPPAAAAAASMSLTVTPQPPAPGTNLAADAAAQLSALAAAIDAGDAAGAQAALNRIAGDIQAIAAQGTTNAAATVQVGGVSTGKAVAVGVGGVLAGGVAGVVGHMMLSGSSFAGESARESKKKKKRS